MPVNQSTSARTVSSRMPWSRLSLLGAVLGLLACGPALAIEPFAVDYEASYMGMSADGKMVLKPVGGDRWRYSLSVENALAELSQVTTFEEHDGHLRPLNGSDSSRFVVKESTRNAKYDWSSGVASWTGDVKPERAGPIKLQAGDLDALMINLALVRDLAAGKPLSYRMVDNGRVKQLDYSVAGTEQVNIGGTSRQATKLVNTDDDKQTVVWVVKGMPAPVRILQREDGKNGLDLRVKSLH